MQLITSTGFAIACGQFLIVRAAMLGLPDFRRLGSVLRAVAFVQYVLLFVLLAVVFLLRP